MFKVHQSMMCNGAAEVISRVKRKVIFYPGRSVHGVGFKRPETIVLLDIIDEYRLNTAHKFHTKRING